MPRFWAGGGAWAARKPWLDNRIATGGGVVQLDCISLGWVHFLFIALLAQVFLPSNMWIGLINLYIFMVNACSDTNGTPKSLNLEKGTRRS